MMNGPTASTSHGAHNSHHAQLPRKPTDMAMAMQLLSSAAAHDVPQHERATPARVVAPTPAVGCFPGASPMPNSNGAWRQSIGGGRHPNGGRAPCATLDLNALINAADSIKTPPNLAYGGDPLAYVSHCAGRAYEASDEAREPRSFAPPFPALAHARCNGAAATDAVRLQHDHRLASASGGSGARPRRQLLSRASDADADDASARARAKRGGRKSAAGAKAAGGRSPASAAAQLARGPGGIQTRLQVLRPWAHVPSAGAIRVIRRKDGCSIARHPGVMNAMACELHTPLPLVRTLPFDASARPPPVESAAAGDGAGDASPAPSPGLADGACSARTPPGAVAHSACWRFGDAVTYATPPAAAAGR